MKILNQIITAAIFIILIFIIKTDYNLYYSNATSYLKNQIEKIYFLSSVEKEKMISVINVNTDNDGLTKEITKIETPGPLFVSDNLLTNNTKNIKLTISGVIDITNKSRFENGNLDPLIKNLKLDFSAEKKLQDMFVKGYFEHISPDGVGVGDLSNQISYEYILIGENLALGNFIDDKALVAAWMASPGHRANILNSKYAEIGVAVGKGSYNGKIVWMAVQHFGLPKSACPSIDEILKGIISLDQNRINDKGSDLTIRRKAINSGTVYEGMTTGPQIEKYNSLVNDYNKIIIDIRNKINMYNEQVGQFNKCISEFN